MKQSHSILGRLLEEISWEGNARHYREGGRGLENVLTAEVFLALDYLPRTRFLGSVIDALAGGNPQARAKLRDEAEAAEISILPGDVFLCEHPPKGESSLSVQPDGVIETNEVYALVEAKRIRRGSFQDEQLSREFVAAHQEARGRDPMLVLILPEPPPVPVRGNGRLSVKDEITRCLDRVLDRTNADLPASGELVESIDATVSWTTWDSIAKVVSTEAERFSSGDHSIDYSVQRLADSLLHAIRWHA